MAPVCDADEGVSNLSCVAVEQLARSIQYYCGVERVTVVCGVSRVTSACGADECWGRS